MKSIVRKITSLFLLIAFVFAITPKEFIHALADHQDTKDCYDHGTITLNNYHIHCQILQLQIQQCKPADKVLLPEKTVFSEIKNYPVFESSSFVTERTISLRGPPSLS